VAHECEIDKLGDSTGVEEEDARRDQSE